MTRPPLPWLVAYRVLGLRLPDAYRPWVAEDVASRFFLFWRIARTVLWLWILVGLYWVVQTRVYQEPGRRAVIQALLVTLAVALLSSGRTLVRRTLRWQLVDRHGRPATPRGLANLGNIEATVLSAAVAVAVVSAMALWAHALRPTGPAGAPCRTPDPQTMSLIRAGLRNPQAQLLHANAVTFEDSTMVAAIVQQPGVTQGTAGVWIVEGSEVFELRTPEQAARSATKFQPPSDVDRLGVEALRRAVDCLTRDRGR